MSIVGTEIISPFRMVNEPRWRGVKRFQVFLLVLFFASRQRKRTNKLKKNLIMKKFKVNWGVVVNAVLTCVTTVISAITLYSCSVHWTLFIIHFPLSIKKMHYIRDRPATDRLPLNDTTEIISLKWLRRETRSFLYFICPLAVTWPCKEIPNLWATSGMPKERRRSMSYCVRPIRRNRKSR